MPSIRILANDMPNSAIGLTMLGAHALECLLKAYLTRNDGTVDEQITKDLKDLEVRHNLNALWERASDDGLTVPRTPPDWVDHLSRLHKDPYPLRYFTGVQSLYTPPPEPMVTELSGLVETVKAAL